MFIPTYVYVLFSILVYMGITRCFARVIKIQRLFIAPLFFMVLSIRSMVSLFNIVPTDIAIWIFGFLSGVLIGNFHVQSRKIKADHKHQLILIPGDWSILMLILVIFSFEFFVHFSIAANWKIASTLLFRDLALMMLGLIAGMSTGRTLNYFLKYQRTISEPLSRENLN